MLISVSRFPYVLYFFANYLSFCHPGNARHEWIRSYQSDTKEREREGHDKRSGDHWPIRECKRRLLSDRPKCWHERLCGKYQIGREIEKGR